MHLSMLSRHFRPHISALHFSFLSDLKNTTAVVESLSTTLTRCSVTEITSLLQDSTDRMRNLYQIIHLLALFLQKKHFFVWLLKLGSLSSVAYKFSLTGGLTFHSGLFCLLLLLNCLRSDLNAHVFQLPTFSSLCCHWYGFKWFSVFLYMIPSSVLIL